MKEIGLLITGGEFIINNGIWYSLVISFSFYENIIHNYITKHWLYLLLIERLIDSVLIL